MSGRKARAGICLLLNNDCDGAEEIFEAESDDIDMAAGKCFISFINSLLSYEPERLEEAVEGLKDLEKRCEQDVGWIKSMRNRVFGSSYSLADPDLADKLEEQIILADCQVCVALLTFLQQDLTSYFKGGWRLRRAWKVYQQTYGVILDLYKKTFHCDNVPGSDWPHLGNFSESASADFGYCDLSVPKNAIPRSASLDPNAQNQTGILRSSLSYLSSFVLAPTTPVNRIPPDVVARLMSAVSFGFGIFQLCVSLLPPNFLRIIHLLGFEGDRQIGLNALMFARNGDDMRGPLALLGLLWYHTIVRPFLALDGSNVQAGVEVACQLYEESKNEFADSALFLFFLGRIQRLKGNIPDSLKAYEAAIVKSPQREVQLLCLHEVGWCYLILLEWKNAFHCFQQLREKSRWSKLLYTYLSAVCIGASGDVEVANRLAQKLPKFLPETTENRTNIEVFIARRVHKIGGSVTKDSCTLLGLELLYLWNALPSSNPSAVLDACQQCCDEPMVGMSTLIQGVIFTYIDKLDKAEASFKETLNARKNIVGDVDDPDGNDDHISAFCGLELATILLQRPQTVDDGKQLLTETRDKYKGYDFENKITLRIHAAMR